MSLPSAYLTYNYLTHNNSSVFSDYQIVLIRYQQQKTARGPTVLRAAQDHTTPWTPPLNDDPYNATGRH